MPNLANPFIALLPYKKERGQPQSFGREDYITAALGVLLHADAEAGGDLCRHLFNRLFEIKLHGSIAVSVQSEQKAAGRSCIIDLLVQTPDQIVFLENKTGARLGLRIDAQTQEANNQLSCYQEELDRRTEFGAASRHLCMLTWAPPERPNRLDYWAGARYWWDLYDAVAHHQPSANASVARLVGDFLELLREVELSPSGSLTASTVHSASAVQRVLALALHRATTEGAGFHDVRPASWGAYLVATKDERSVEGATDLQWTVGFWAGFPEVRCGNRGYIVVTLPDTFLEQTHDDQVEWIAEHIWWRVARADSIVRQLPKMSKQTLLERCLTAREEVEALLMAATGANWKLYIGGRELVLSTGSRTAAWKIKLDTWNKGGANVRVETPNASTTKALTGRLSEVLGVAAKPSHKGTVADFRLAAVPPGRLQELPALIDGIRKPRKAA